MTKLGYDEQMEIIASVLKSEIKKMDTMTKTEAKKEARKGLISIGVLDKRGKLKKPYVTLGK